jgi:hypothetical protein
MFCDAAPLWHYFESFGGPANPRKCDHDGLDACICLLVAHYLADGKVCLLVGDMDTGYIVVPHYEELSKEPGRPVRRDWTETERLGAKDSAVISGCSRSEVLFSAKLVGHSSGSWEAGKFGLYGATDARNGNIGAHPGARSGTQGEIRATPGVPEVGF